MHIKKNIYICIILSIYTTKRQFKGRMREQRNYDDYIL